MNKKIVRMCIGISFIILTTIIGNNQSYALEDSENYSELYKQYLELSDEEKANVSAIPDKYTTSLREYNNGGSVQTTSANPNVLPERYNLAEHYEIKVENQGSEGNCWAFASLETLETYLQIHGYGTFDFSESHLNYVESNLFSETEATRQINTGGGYNEFTEYLNKKFGPVSEESFPYYEDESALISKKYTQEELDNFTNATPLAYVGEYAKFPSVSKENGVSQYSDEELTEYRNEIKQHIMENGAIATTITAPSYYSGEFYNLETYAAYFPSTENGKFTEHSHLVAIIGWDDNFSKENFLECNRPQNDGAYIVLNSWGKGFGNSGIYYISYDDAFVEENLKGIKEAVTNVSEFSNTTTFEIPDENLYIALKSTLGKKIASSDDNTHTITMLSGMINEISYLDLIDFNITDLSGIENFRNLIGLNVSHNNISDIHPLILLQSLDNIDLSYNKLETIPTELSNAELERLSLSYNPIRDFSGIANIKKVSNLELEGTDILEADLGYLKNLKITSLNLAKTNIKDYSVLKTLNDAIESDGYIDKDLNNLNISYNQNIDYTSIPDVYFLNISNTDVDDSKFNQIPETTKLIALDISYTNIKDMNIVADKPLRAIYISGNRNLENIDKLKYVGMITYKDAGLTDVSIFKDFYTSQLDLASNEITSYEVLAENGFLNFLDLANNKITETPYMGNTIVFLDGNNIKPVQYYPDGLESAKNQKYVETLRIDPDKENIFQNIAIDLSNMQKSGIRFDITNATIDYENLMLQIEDYDKDVVIEVKNGIYEGSTITYKIEKQTESDISYIYIDRTNVKTKYVEGENFDKEGLKVYAYYDNSRTQITDYTITGADNLHVGSNIIQVEKGGFSDYIEIDVIPSDDILTLSFESKDIYDATLKQIKQLEQERREYAYIYDRIEILINNDDVNKTIQIYKSDLENITRIEIEGDEVTSLEDVKQLKGLTGITINCKNLEDLSPLLYIEELLRLNEELMPSERFLGIEIKNNDKITKLGYDIFRMLGIENSKIADLSNLTNLVSLVYKGTEVPNITEILDTIQIIMVDVSANIEDVERDENNNIVLPELIKVLRDMGFEVEAVIYDQLRSEEYLNPYNKNNIDVIDDGENLILRYEDIKNVDYQGKNQFIGINVKDVNSKYTVFNFKYNLKYKLFKSLELESDEVIEIEEDMVPDLSGITVYKVYSNKEKEEITDFAYSKDNVTLDTNKIEISYSEDGITSKIDVPIKVTEHVHEWEEWKVTKQATETEEGQKERVCLKNKNHKEIAKIEKLTESEYKVTVDVEKNIEDTDSSESVEAQEKNKNRQTASIASPKTGDKGIVVAINLIIASILGILGTIKCVKRNKKD